LILHNGQGPQSIVQGRMRKWLFNNLDTTNYARAFVVANYQTNEVWVCFPESGMAACTLALVWNWQDDTFSTRQLSNVTYGGSGQPSSRRPDRPGRRTRMRGALTQRRGTTTGLHRLKAG
jgi:hypothetical protein